VTYTVTVKRTITNEAGDTSREEPVYQQSFDEDPCPKIILALNRKARTRKRGAKKEAGA